MPNKSAITVLLCGVGGQGTILAADILAHAAIASGITVKVSEIHGMAQRGGAVTTVVRFGEKVNTMVADLGCADCVVSFETTEALRNLPYLKEGGYLLVADETIKPMPVPAGELARTIGSPKSVNVVLLGALSSRLDFPVSAWEQVIRDRVPQKTIDANIKAFHAGRDFALKA